jgi:hypothetical protein
VAFSVTRKTVRDSNFKKPTAAYLPIQAFKTAKNISGKRRMTSRMLHRVALVITDVSEECIASIIRVTTIGELRTTLAVTSTSILVNLMMEAIRSCETLVLARASRCNIRKDGNLLSHRRGNLRSYNDLHNVYCRRGRRNRLTQILNFSKYTLDLIFH